MKLLMCNSCGDIFNLTREPKQCSCKLVWGRYIDNLNAEFFGNATLIGFANPEFLEALSFKGLNFKAFTIKEPCQTFKRLSIVS